MADILLGTAYMTAEDFISRAFSFGCGGPVIAAFSEAEVDAVLASASRAIDGYTNRAFTPNPQTETQSVDFYTRRIRVDKPPVVSITSATLRTYPTPVNLDVSQWVVNNAESYIEIPSGQLGTNSSTHAFEYPDVGIVYVSAQTLPPTAVLSAVGFVAAEVINRNYVNKLAPPGVTEISTKTQTITLAPFNPAVKSIPEIARQILAGDTDISPRMVPKGYPSRYLKGAPQYRVP